MGLEVFAVVNPIVDLAIEVIAGNTDLYKYCQYGGCTYSDGLVHEAVLDNSAEKFLAGSTQANETCPCGVFQVVNISGHI